jgi:hypothetical protein
LGDRQKGHPQQSFVKIEILDDAQQDLIEGFQFYEARETGVGSYFLDCLFSDIDSLLLFGGIH